MNHPWRISGIALVCGVAILLGGCSDQPAEPHARPKLQTGENRLTVKSEITLYDKNGGTHSYTKTQLLQTEQVGGVVRATVVAPGGGARASIQIDDGSAPSSGYTGSLTPVVGVRYGSGVANYTQYVTDSTTMKIYKVVAKGPMIYNSPIDVAYAYDSRGYLVAELHYKWSAVSGGYALLAQKEMSYTSAGALNATVTSYVSSPVTYVASAQTPASFASLLRKVACYFGPSVAYAQGAHKGGGGGGGGVVGYSMPLPGSSCWGEAGVLGLNIGIIGFESATEMELWELPLYLGSWTALGHSLWHYLDCLDRPPRCTASTCTGGGGSSW
jgi:hypothetical protein